MTVQCKTWKWGRTIGNMATIVVGFNYRCIFLVFGITGILCTPHCNVLPNTKWYKCLQFGCCWQHQSSPIPNIFCFDGLTSDGCSVGEFYKYVYSLFSILRCRGRCAVRCVRRDIERCRSKIGQSAVFSVSRVPSERLPMKQVKILTGIILLHHFWNLTSYKVDCGPGYEHLNTS